MADWKPTLGGRWNNGKASFRVWAPSASALQIEIESGSFAGRKLAMQLEPEGTWSLEVESLQLGDMYRFRMDGNPPWPDPASRFQPSGVHGPSQLIDSSSFPWSDAAWKGVERDNLMIYELHVGTFTREGTFAAAAKQLPYLRDLGITCVELMPIADFPGSRNWGYDGVSLFAPSRCYGTPHDLFEFVNAAHLAGVAVLLDVVYNHLGPDGAYIAAFSPFVFSKKHRSPWGAGLNFDGPRSEQLRRFFIENALHWIHDYHFDGLRLDATHAIVDDSPKHFLAELRETIDASMQMEQRKVLVIAEDDRNLARIAMPESEGGFGLDGIWADDLHHQIHRYLTGQSDGYFADFSGTVADIAMTAKKGWFYCGQRAQYFGGKRGSDPLQLPPPAFVVCLQNHDQVGNRAMGERLSHLVDLASCRAAAVLLLLLPETPLLFMGQEWASSSPFQYFTDHNAELGRLVTEGRRREFARFASFSDPAARERIPDPQEVATFSHSKLRWEDLNGAPHAGVLRLYRTLLHLRANHAAMKDTSRSSFNVAPLGEDGLLVQRHSGGSRIAAVIRLKDEGACDCSTLAIAVMQRDRLWRTVLTTEDRDFCADSMGIEFDSGRAQVRFQRPGAMILENGPTN